MKTFVWHCSFNKLVAQGSGRSKKEAKIAAAKAIRDNLDYASLPPPTPGSLNPNPMKRKLDGRRQDGFGTKKPKAPRGFGGPGGPMGPMGMGFGGFGPMGMMGPGMGPRGFGGPPNMMGPGFGFGQGFFGESRQFDSTVWVNFPSWLICNTYAFKRCCRTLRRWG